MKKFFKSLFCGHNFSRWAFYGSVKREIEIKDLGNIKITFDNGAMFWKQCSLCEKRKEKFLN